jgi:DNA-binding transcriptional regulator GbsR (MarR family)
MHYKDENVLNSERAYQILRAVTMADEGSYATAVSKEHDMDRSMVAELISKMHDMELLEKGKRERAQYYVLNHDGLLPLFDELWSDVFDQPADDTTAALHELNEPRGDQEADRDEQLQQYLHRYIEEYLERNTSSTIREMLVGDFYRGLSAQAESLHRAREALRMDDAGEGEINRLRLPFWVNRFLQQARRHYGARNHAEQAAFHAFLDSKEWDADTFRSMIDRDQYTWAYREFFNT